MHKPIQDSNLHYQAQSSAMAPTKAVTAPTRTDGPAPSGLSVEVSDPVVSASVSVSVVSVSVSVVDSGSEVSVVVVVSLSQASLKLSQKPAYRLATISFQT